VAIALLVRDGAVQVAAHLADEIGSAVIAAVVVPAPVVPVGEGRRDHAEQRDDHNAQEDGRPFRPRASARSSGEDARTGMHKTLVATIGSRGCET